MSKQLKERLIESIQSSAEGCISFSAFMEASLYDPSEGYYTSERQVVGRQGDFLTSVSVGACFGHLLASHVVAAWQAMGKPTPFALIEQGAHDGTLMADLLQGLKHPVHGDPEAAEAARPHFIEPLPHQQQNQQNNLPPDSNGTWHRDLSGLSDLDMPGVFVCNELVDAFPVHRIRWRDGSWQELGVAVDEAGKIIEKECPWSSAQLREASQRLPTDLAENYTTEINLAATEWIDELARSGFRGHLLAIDYGFSRADYYLPQRVEGSLQGYRKHQAVTAIDDLLNHPGACDLTAHVEFSSLAEAALASGCSLAGFCNQARLLTSLATPWLKSLEGAAPSGQDASKLGQFRTLTVPGGMGGKFHALGLWIDFPPAPLVGFTLGDAAQAREALGISAV